MKKIFLIKLWYQTIEDSFDWKNTNLHPNIPKTESKTDGFKHVRISLTFSNSYRIVYERRCLFGKRLKLNIIARNCYNFIGGDARALTAAICSPRANNRKVEKLFPS